MSKLVYFIECNGRVKIGESANPAKRLAKVSSDSPFPCRLMGICRTFSEADVHARFSHLREHGEWHTSAHEISQFVVEHGEPPISRKPKGTGRALVQTNPILEKIDIATERKSLGITQAELARAMGVNQSSVSLWERQKRLPRGPAQRVLRQVLDELSKRRAS